MTEQYRPNLGEIPDETARRDAVHIAVAPVVAGVDIAPGQHVGLFTDGTASPSKPWIGIADPFFKDHISRGQRFWLYLYPNTITNLRHVWEHPAFTTKVPPLGI